MRSIRGWIINLLDGLAPPPSTVQVHAKSEATNTDLDVSLHGIGRFDRVHYLGGSASPILADNAGHFGWDMELSPGLIDVSVTPTDPQTEYRRRFPDESAQIGKAFISDLERVGWSGGWEGGIVWGAIGNANDIPITGIEFEPRLSWSIGNGSIASFGSGSNAGRFVLRRFIAFLGGVPFTVELNDLVVPITGQPAAPPNLGSADRWDLYCLVMHDEPGSALHGKQSFEMTQGSPGGGIPNYPAQAFPVRKLPLHACRMPPGGSVYNDAFDLRVWQNAPSGLSAGADVEWTTQTLQDISVTSAGDVAFDSLLNSSIFADRELVMDRKFRVMIQWTGIFHYLDGKGGFLLVECVAQGIDALGTIQTPNFTPQQRLIFVGTDDPTRTGKAVGFASATWQPGQIFPYQAGNTGLGGSRTWSNFRVQFRLHNNNVPNVQFRAQTAHLTAQGIAH